MMNHLLWGSMIPSRFSCRKTLLLQSLRDSVCYRNALLFTRTSPGTASLLALVQIRISLTEINGAMLDKYGMEGGTQAAGVPAAFLTAKGEVYNPHEQCLLLPVHSSV